jgi:hypothetical protein
MKDNRNKIEVIKYCLALLLLSQLADVKSEPFSIKPNDCRSAGFLYSFFIDLPAFTFDFDFLAADIDDPDDFNANRNSNSNVINLSVTNRYTDNSFIRFNYRSSIPGNNALSSIIRSADLPPPTRPKYC